MTRLQLQFILESPELPLNMDCVIVSFLKAAVQNYSQEWFEQLYDKKKSIIKMFSWSCYYPGARFTKNKILLDQNYFLLTFSDADMKELLQFYNAFTLMRKRRHPMSQNSMMLNAIRIQDIPEITDSEIIVKVQSSLIARRHNSEEKTNGRNNWHPEIDRNSGTFKPFICFRSWKP